MYFKIKILKLYKRCVNLTDFIVNVNFLMLTVHLQIVLMFLCLCVFYIILGVVKRNPLFLHEIEWKNNGFLFTTPNICYFLIHSFCVNLNKNLSTLLNILHVKCIANVSLGQCK